MPGCFQCLCGGGVLDQLTACISARYGYNNGIISLKGLLYEILGIQIGWGLKNYSINDVTWYVDVLLICYLLFFVIKKIEETLKVQQQMIWPFMIGIGWIVFWNGWNYPVANWIVARGLTTFFLGLIIADVLNRVNHMLLLRDVVTSLIICGLSVIYVLKNNISSDCQNYVFIFGLFVPLIIVAGNPFACSDKAIGISSVMANTSFVLYMLHSPIIKLLRFLESELCFSWHLTVRGMFLLLILSFLFSFVIYQIYEKPVSRLLRLYYI